MLLLLVLVTAVAAQGNDLPCMEGSDARYITTSRALPREWINTGWHHGNYIQIPDDHYQGLEVTPLKLGNVSVAEAIRWFQVPESDYHILLSKDTESILCTISQSGLQLQWLFASQENKFNLYCQWKIIVDPENSNLFQIKSAELIQAIENMGAVYWDKTGLFQTYDMNSQNNPENEVEEYRTWWRWEKVNDDQREFTDMSDVCTEETDDVGDEISAIQVRGAIGGTTVQKRKKTFVFEDAQMRCRNGWLLFDRRCYKIFTSPTLSFEKANAVCLYFGSTLAVPTHRKIHGFLRRLITKYGNKLYYWLGMKATENRNRRGGPVYRGVNNEPIGYSKWWRRKDRSFNGDDLCVVMQSRGWVKTSCSSLNNVLCSTRATPQRGVIECGSIQDEELDTTMRSMAGVEQPVVVDDEVEDEEERVVGGTSAIPAQFPWQAAVRFKVGRKYGDADGLVFHNCGGTLIHSCWVLTAAHCFASTRSPKDYEVRLGDYAKDSVDEGEQLFDVDNIILHENYQQTPSARNDIALMKLSGPDDQNCAKMTKFVQPACLPTREWNIKAEGQKCQVSGWGVTDPDLGQRSAANVLNYVTLPTISNKLCSRRYNSRARLFIPKVMMCAGKKEGGQDACSGDSGGPYVCRGPNNKYAVFGIVSFGVGCARQRYPGVYTRVTNFIPWINQKIYGS